MNLAQSYFEIGGLRIDEPVTALTDILISAVCFLAFRKLGKINLKNKVYIILRYYFFTMGVVTMVNGLFGHAFYYYFSSRWKIFGWLASMISITLLEYASVEYVIPLIGRKVAKIFKWFVITELLLFIYLTISSQQFIFVAVHMAFGLILIVAGLNTYVFMKRRTKGSLLFLFAVFLFAGSALVFMKEWSLSIWFNHLDISHVFLATSAHYTYLGSVTILENPLFI